MTHTLARGATLVLLVLKAAPLRESYSPSPPKMCVPLELRSPFWEAVRIRKEWTHESRCNTAKTLPLSLSLSLSLFSWFTPSSS